MKVRDLWYLEVELATLISGVKDTGIRHKATKRVAEARESSTSEGLFPKLVDDAGGSPIIKDQPPTIFHWKGQSPGGIHRKIMEVFARYRQTLAPASRVLLDRYDIKDAAHKVVGVGSVGTSCWVLLLTDAEGDPLILQIKEARASVLENYAGKSVYPKSRGTRCQRPPAHAACQRHLPRLDRRWDRRTSLLCPPVAGRQNQASRRDLR